MQTFINYIIRLITMPFLKLVRMIKKQSNISAAMKKVTKPMIAVIQNILKLKPSKWEDYIAVGNWMVAKKIVLLFVLLLCSVSIIYLSKFKDNRLVAEALSQQEEKIFQYDDTNLPEYTGKAIIKARNGEIVYKGDIVTGICTGWGQVYNLIGKLVYEGELKENNYSGKGKVYDETGRLIYEGEFNSNKYNGIGILYDYQRHWRYEGNFAEGIKEGKGIIYNAKNQVIYEGDFSKDVYHGQGILHNEITGEWYTGAFANGKKQGSGILYNARNEVIFEGTYSNDLFDGDAMRYWNNKLMYVGPYKAGKRESIGKEYNNDGKLVYEGDIVLGKRHGKGVQYDGISNRKIYEGSFFDGKRQGDGTIYNLAGKELFTGKLFNDEIDCSAYLDENLQTIEAAFKERPKLIYKEQKGYYVYEELGVILVANLDENTLSALLLQQEETNAAAKEGQADGYSETNQDQPNTQTEGKAQPQEEVIGQNTGVDKTKIIVEQTIMLKSLAQLPEGLKLEDEGKKVLLPEDYLGIFNLQKMNKKLLTNIKVSLLVRGNNMQEILSATGKTDLYVKSYSSGKLKYELIYQDKKTLRPLYYKIQLMKG